MKKPLPAHFVIHFRALYFSIAAMVLLLISFQHASAQTQFTAYASSINGTSEPYADPGYSPDGNFFVTVENGPDCATTTFTVNATPVTGSGPDASTPPSTVVVNYIGFPAGNFFFDSAGAGTYTVTVTETGGACSPTFTTNPVVFEVNVPEGLLSCPDDIAVGNDPGECAAVVDYDPYLTVDPVTLTYSFEFDGSVVDSGSGTGSGSTFEVGTTLVTLTAENSQGIESCTFSVTVVDSEAPVVVNAGELDATYECKGEIPDPNPDVLVLDDNCSNSFSVTWAPDIITNGDCLHNYTLQRIYTIGDNNGNSTIFTQTFTVDDQTAPVLVGTLPGEDLGNACLSEMPEPPAVDAIAGLYEDNCSGLVSGTLVDTESNGTDCAWAVTYTYNVSDICGNTVTPVIVYTGGNIEPPVVVVPCREDQDVLVDEGACVFTVPDTSWDAVFVDYCSGGIIIPDNVLLPPLTEFGTDKNEIYLNGNVLTPTYTLSGATTGTGTSLESVTFNLGETEVVWDATDDCGNQASCTFTVTVSPRSLSGIISYYKYDAPDLPIEGVLVRLMNGATQIDYAYTDASGYYSFDDPVDLEGADRVEVSTDIPHGGLSSGDALAVSLRVANNDPSYWGPAGPPVDYVKFLDHVGDVNATLGTLNTTDAFYLFRRHVGLENEFDAGDWAFYATNDETIFTNTSANTAYRMYDMSYCEMDISVRTYGDVRGTYNPVGQAPVPSKSLIPVQSDEVMNVIKGETFELPVTVDQNTAFNALSFYLDYASDKLEVLEVQSDMPGMVAMIEHGTIRVEWYDLASQSLSAGDAFITLVARTKGEVTPADVLFKLGSATEFVDATAQTIPAVDVSVSSLNTTDAITSITDPDQLGVSLNAFPNPFRNELTLNYQIDEPGSVRMTLVGMTGATIAELVNHQHESGSYTYQLNPGSMALDHGVYFVRMEVQNNNGMYNKHVKLIYMK